jgi:two-component system, OmpR family, phosphate regulon sensor histidine kinase PhoR
VRASLKTWSSRRLLVLFVAVTLVPAVGLIWLGVTLIRQDGELADKQLRDQLNRKAIEIGEEIRADLTAPADISKPNTKPLTVVSVPAGIWRVADEAERRKDVDAAVRENQRLAQSANRQVRAEALIRLARVLRNAERSDEALAVWQRLLNMDDVYVFDDPASLQAALARMRELEKRGDTDAQRREAGAIRDDLRRGRWQVSGPTLESAWNTVAQPAHFAVIWRERWRQAGVVVRLTDMTGSEVVESGPLSGPDIVRSPHESGLPWTIRVASASSDSELVAFSSRRRSLLLVLSLAAFLVIAGAYFVARGVRRELAVAELQSNFVSAVSHEFRTPLTSMSHLIELLRDRMDMDAARRARYYDALEQETGRLRRFVDQLLDFGRVDAGAVRYHFARVQPRALVDVVVDRFRSGPAAQGRTVSTDVDANLPEVEIDEEAFALALNNLLENAAKYSPAQSPIHVGLHKDDAARNVVVAVRDQGQGIPRSEHQIIFDKFVRGAAAQASGVGGTGVGLALAREIIRAHGGDIRVESEIGRGSTFSISLPLEVATRHLQLTT